MAEHEIELRQKNPEQTEKMAQFESPNGDEVCASYISREVADQLGEFATLTISESASVEANLDSVSGNGTGNYAVFETPGGAITGLYISHDACSEVTGEDIERDADGVVTNAPETLGLTLSPSDEDSFEEADSVDEEEVDGLLGGSDEDEDETVEISDEELGLVSEN